MFKTTKQDICTNLGMLTFDFNEREDAWSGFSVMKQVRELGIFLGFLFWDLQPINPRMRTSWG